MNEHDNRPTHLDLFSGIGGFSLAFESVGFRTIGFSEIDAYASAVLKKHWPAVPNYGDRGRHCRLLRRDSISGKRKCYPTRARSGELEADVVGVGRRFAIMPNRQLRDGILTSEKVATLDWPEEVFYRRLLSAVDDFGRYHANPKILRSTLYPLQVDRVREADISRWIAACVKAGLIVLYKAGDTPYLVYLNLRERVRAKKSKYPDPPADVLAHDGICQQMPAHAPEGDSDSDSDGDTAYEGESNTPPRRSSAKGLAELPSLKEWLDYCEMHGGPVRWWAEKEWHYQEARAWKGIVYWQKHANGERVKWEHAGRPMAPPNHGGGVVNAKHGTTRQSINRNAGTMQRPQDYAGL